jgi:hypothetical protein
MDGSANQLYEPIDLPDVLPARLLPAYRKLSPKAQQLYDILPKVSWMTKETLARQIRCRTSDIKALKDELEKARLIEIRFTQNKKRPNPRHEIRKTSRIGTPICKHFKKAVCFEEWGSSSSSSSSSSGGGGWRRLDRNQQIEFYLKSGWEIVPFKERGKQPHAGFCSHAWGRMSAAEKMDFFFNHPKLNVGLVVCSHCLVVDIDSKENDLINQPGFQNTLTVSTPRGYHCYFRKDAIVRTSVKTLPNVDTRGPGNYLVLPPSIHPSGEPYEWEHINFPNLLPVEFRQEWRKMDFEYSKFSSWQSLPENIPYGTRNATLWSYGRSLRCKGKNYHEIKIELLAANRQKCTPKFSDWEIEKLAAHVFHHPDRQSFANL